MILLPEGTTEPRTRAWNELPMEDFAVALVAFARERQRERGWRGPAIIAINGRSGAGKSTLAKAVAELSGGVVLEADDLMWWEPMWQWAPLAVQGVLEPLHRGADVHLVPPQWKSRGREGSIAIPNDTPVVVFEGNGSSQLAFAEYLAASVWVQSDCEVARERGLARDIESGVNGSPEQAGAFWDEWDRSEVAFHEADMPWFRADFTLLGTADPMPTPGTVRIARG